MSHLLIKSGGPFRVFCYPYAGGSAVSFSHLIRHLPEGFSAYGSNPLVYDPQAGRRELGYPDALDRCWNDLLPLLETPYALFGYSLGGLFVHDLLGRLEAGGLPPPEFAVICATVPPTLMEAARRKRGWFQMDDAEITESLRTVYGLPPALLEDGDFLSAFLPIYRADSRIFHTYPHDHIRPTQSPVLVYSGNRDPSITPAGAREWLKLGPAARLQIVDGGHMFLTAQGARIAADMALLADMAGSGRADSRYAAERRGA